MNLTEVELIRIRDHLREEANLFAYMRRTNERLHVGHLLEAEQVLARLERVERKIAALRESEGEGA